MVLQSRNVIISCGWKNCSWIDAGFAPRGARSPRLKVFANLGLPNEWRGGVHCGRWPVWVGVGDQFSFLMTSCLSPYTIYHDTSSRRTWRHVQCNSFRRVEFPDYCSDRDPTSDQFSNTFFFYSGVRPIEVTLRLTVSQPVGPSRYRTPF